nr:SDR family oxidoreductase [Kineococcus aurantiacus]
MSGYRAVVTGAAGGIGSAISAVLRRAGAHVTGVDRSQSAPADVDEYVSGDLTEATVRKEALARLGDQRDRCILVNNAGLVLDKRLAETSEEETRQLFEVNAIMPMLFTAELAAAGHQGAVVNIASILSFAAERSTGPYTMTKGAIANHTRVAALEYAGQLRVNAVCPGSVRTPMVTRGWHESGDPSRAERRVSSLYPVGRIGEPSDIANVVAFLCSDLAAFVNGALWTVDGGITAANAEWALEQL